MANDRWSEQFWKSIQQTVVVVGLCHRHHGCRRQQAQQVGFSEFPTAMVPDRKNNLMEKMEWDYHPAEKFVKGIPVLCLEFGQYEEYY